MARTHADVMIRAMDGRGSLGRLESVDVDDATMSTWLPRALLEAASIAVERDDSFARPDGTIISRPLGFALIVVQDRETVENVVFAEPGDWIRLSAHALSGLNLRIAPDGTLVDGGPIIAAAIGRSGLHRNGDGHRGAPGIVARAHDQPLLWHRHPDVLGRTLSAALPRQAWLRQGIGEHPSPDRNARANVAALACAGVGVGGAASDRIAGELG